MILPKDEQERFEFILRRSPKLHCFMGLGTYSAEEDQLTPWNGSGQWTQKGDHCLNTKQVH